MNTIKLIVVVSLCSFSSCIVEPSWATGAQQVAVSRPPPAQPIGAKVGANFGDVAELQNVTVNPGQGITGESVRVSMFFKVNNKIDRDYLIFVHVEDIEGRVDRLNVDHPPRAKPTSQWQPGEMIRDDFDIPIPPGMPVKGLSVAMGFWDPKTDERLTIVNKDAVKTDGRDRLFLVSFPVANVQ
jgi:hypothetical protein